MSDYNLSNGAKEDLIRIHRYGVDKFGMEQADKYFNAFFEHFEMIAQKPYSYPSVDFINPGYRRCVCGVESIYFTIQHNQEAIMTIIGRQDFDGLGE
jgi:toxin ParE1/3/4